MTPAEFLLGYPEFAETDASLVSAKLAEAETLVGALPEPHRTTATGLQAAHLLAISPAGRNARLVNEDGTTTYHTTLERVLRLATLGPRSSG